MQKDSFEVGFRNAIHRSSLRELTPEDLKKFIEYFGEYPKTMSNHYVDGEGICW